MKKIAIFMLTVTLMLSTAAWHNGEHSANAASVSFSDIQGHWAADSINGAVAKGYVDGYPDGTFGPDVTVSRAEFVKMMVVALGLEVGLANGKWYTPYVYAAQAAGIYVPGDFGDPYWDKPLTRLEMSKVAVRALDITDVEPTQWMYHATQNGIINGTAPGELSPDGTTTRAQAVTVIERVLAVKDGQELPVDKYAVSAAEIMWHNTNIMTMLPRYFKDSYYKGETFDYKSMVSSSPDGKAVCKITQLVAVDLGDPKDPNRKIIENTEFAWVGDNKYHKLKDSDGYAVLGISEITITDKPSVTDLFPCTVTIYNDDWYQMPENARNPKMPNRNYGIMPYDPKYESFIFRVDVSNLAKGTVYYVKGTLIPKGNFSSNRPFDIKFSGFGNWHGSVETIYSGKLNPEYSQ